jgi:hypothetical protein
MFALHGIQSARSESEPRTYHIIISATNVLTLDDL